MESSPPILFDRALLRKRRARVAADFAQYDFLHHEAAERLAESLSFIARPLPTIVELGCHTGALTQRLATRAGTTAYIACDLTPATLTGSITRPDTVHLVAADEELLPFAENSVDAVVSVLALHWINDLPGTLAQIARILKPDGLFMAILPGGETLHELRSIFAATEVAQRGGVTPRIAPFIDVRDAGALLQRAGFALPVADSDHLTVTHPSLFALMADLRGAAQNNMLQQQAQHFTSRGFFLEAAARYQQQHSDPTGQLVSTVELVTMTGWKPAPNQQQPARRGSGQISLAKALQ